MKPEIVVEIDQKGGSVSLEVKGESGTRCLETTQFLEIALGEAIDRNFKADCLVQKAKVNRRLKARGRDDT